MELWEWMEKHKVLTILIVWWLLIVSSWVIFRVFGDNPPVIDMGTATAFASLLGIPTLAVGLWKWRGEK